MNIEIISDIKKRMKEDNKYIDGIIAGAKIDHKKSRKRLIMTPDVFVKVFSPEKMRLILKVRKDNIKSIYSLAKSLNRRYEAVYRDIKYLEGMNIIKIKTKDNQKIP